MTSGQNSLYIRRRSDCGATTQRGGAGKPSGSERAACNHGSRDQSPARTPIWLAALMATQCQAVSDGDDHAVRWNCVSGRAVYTNTGAGTELIQPFGVWLQGGHSLAVFWVPGETAYSMEVY